MAIKERTGRSGSKYWCLVCSHMASCGRDLARHIEAKHVITVFVCNICNKKLKGSRGLRSHLHSFHQIKDVEDMERIMNFHINERMNITYKDQPVSI